MGFAPLVQEDELKIFYLGLSNSLENQFSEYKPKSSYKKSNLYQITIDSDDHMKKTIKSDLLDGFKPNFSNQLYSLKRNEWFIYFSSKNNRQIRILK